jgi:hypothetical protein
VADIKIAYRASSNLTATALNGGVASSGTWVAGWTSGTIDNTSELDIDKLISAQFTVESSGLTAGEIRVYVYAMLDDSTWPDVFSSGTEGTEGTATIHDANVRDSHFRLLWATATDTTASQKYPMPATSVAAAFGGILPPKFAVFVTHSTVAALETSGNQVTVKGVNYTSA